MMSSFIRFMVLLAKSTQDVTKKTYSLVPIQNFDEDWSDDSSDDEDPFHVIWDPHH